MKFFKSVTSHALGPPLPVTNCHTFSDPLEHDVLYGRPLAAKFDCCISLLSFIHTLLVNILRCVRLYIKRKLLLLLLLSVKSRSNLKHFEELKIFGNRKFDSIHHSLTTFNCGNARTKLLIMFLFSNQSYVIDLGCSIINNVIRKCSHKY